MRSAHRDHRPDRVSHLPDSLALHVVYDCAYHAENLAFDLATSRLALEFWADHPAAQDVVAIVTELEDEHQRHCEAITAFADRIQAFLHTAGPLAHVHLRPAEPYRQRVETKLYPPTPPRS